MTFTDAVKICFIKYADFSGSAPRSEFWWWVLFTVVATVALEQVNYGLPSAF